MNDDGDAHESNGHNGHGDAADLTAAVDTARRGFRRDVQVLVDALPEGDLLVPLAEPIPGATDEGIELAEGLELHPHLLPDAEGKLWCALFTRGEFLHPVADALQWSTSNEALQYVAVPAHVAFDMALDAIDEDTVLGLIINVMSDDHELMLRRAELASLVAGKALPLVGYVRDIPEQEFEESLEAEGDPLPPAFLSALEACVRDIGELEGFTVRRTFNPDRDLEPHPTIELTVAPRTDRESLARRIGELVEPHVPEPGYVDIVFKEPAN